MIRMKIDHYVICYRLLQLLTNNDVSLFIYLFFFYTIALIVSVIARGIRQANYMHYMCICV